MPTKFVNIWDKHLNIKKKMSDVVWLGIRQLATKVQMKWMLTVINNEKTTIKTMLSVSKSSTIHNGRTIQKIDSKL